LGARYNIENLRVCALHRLPLGILAAVSYSCITFYTTTFAAVSVDPTIEAIGETICEIILIPGDAR
jgi:hypothetical protein